MGKEIWKAVRGFKGYYEVSDAGRVRSISSARKTKHKPTILKFLKHPGGYHRFLFWKRGVYKNVFCHRLVAEAFLGRARRGMQAMHLNGIKTDNRLSNLKWGTPSENQRDRENHATKRSGVPRPPYKTRSVATIEKYRREFSKAGMSITRFAKIKNIPRTTMADWINGRTRK